MQRDCRSISRRRSRLAIAALLGLLGSSLLAGLHSAPRSLRVVGPQAASAALPACLKPVWSPSALRRAEEIQASGRVLVLTYHEVWPGHHPFNVDPKVFDRQMSIIRSSGRPVITTRTLADALLNGKPVPEGAILIHFDDSYSGVWRYASPIMRKYNLVGTVNVIGIDTYVPDVGAGHLTMAQLKALVQAGWDIESHSWNLHAPSPVWYGNAPEEIVREDAARENRLVQDITRCPAIALVYPGGALTPATYAAAKADYALAFIGDSRAAGSLRNSVWAWPRVTVTESTNLSELLARAH